MKRLILAVTILTGMTMTTNNVEAAPLDEFRWKNRVLVVVAPLGDPMAEQQRRIYNSAVKGMSERAIVLSEAVDGSERSRRIRSLLGADGTRFQVFLVGKDGNTATSSDEPVSANYLFGRVDAMPMRRDEMRRTRWSDRFPGDQDCAACRSNDLRPPRSQDA